MKKMGDATVTAGDMKEFLMTSPEIAEDPEVMVALMTIPDDTTINLGDVMEVVEQNNGAYAIEMKSAELNQLEKFASTPENVRHSWSMLGLEILAYAALATVALEFIDKDKR